MPFFAYLASMDAFLWPGLPPELKIPVLIYSIAITAMAVGAAGLFGKMERRAALIVFGGAVLFVGSDSLLAIHRFHAPLPGAGFFIMLTYILGQSGIALGMWRGLSFFEKK